MKKHVSLIFIGIVVILLTAISSCASNPTSDKGNDNEFGNEMETGGINSDIEEVLEMKNFRMSNGKTVYCFVPQAVKNNPQNRVPMVLFMCGTTCDPVDNCVQSGWLNQAQKSNFIVVSPDYNNYATYSETEFIKSVVEYMIENYPVDSERIYATGFSNGGAMSVALTRDYPQYFAAISAMGWMVDLTNKDNVFENYDMPFQVVQGTKEFTVQTQSGAFAVMDDEKRAIRSLFLYNEWIDGSHVADYDETPYWGYKPNTTRTEIKNGKHWEYSNYLKDGYENSFAQLVLIEDAVHMPHTEEAEVAWNFFKNFKRNTNGKIEEVK